MYCGPLLLNINPGPNYVNDYLNLKNWLKETQNVPDFKWKPHLYSFVNCIYQNLITENKDQTVNMLGQIGSGKTFNLVHILEYFCHYAGMPKYQLESFDIIHKSIQLVHILGSILRQNNLESTSCGMLLRLGFNEEHKICNFDIEAKILDFTLPFSQNGRTFSILHALMTGGNFDVKRSLELPEHDYQLNFFKKFSKNFDEKTKEKFKLNDLEIWTRFHSLLNYFKFSKNEILELLQLFSFILLCNEAAIGKKIVGKFGHEEYCINKGHSSKKLAKVFGMDEDEFMNRFSTFKELAEIKNILISLMKNTYYIIFEFVKNKVKSSLKSYFEKISGMKLTKVMSKENNQSFSANIPNIKYINFIDFPGEIEDQTLGGLSNNLANECLNVMAGSQYLSVVDKIQEEKLNLKYFQPLHSNYVLKSLLGPCGIFNFLSHPFTEENFDKLKAKVQTKKYYHKCLEFNPNPSHEFIFNVKFSHMKISYNYESLYLETKSLIVNNRLTNIFAGSKNSIIKSTYKNVLEKNKNFYVFTMNTIKDLFKPIENHSPYVIYCLHSNNSLKPFFGGNDKTNSEHKQDWVIPYKLTMDMLKNSLAIPILFWEWFGYHEWVSITNFVKEFADDFEKIKEVYIKFNKINKLKDVSLKDLNPFETVTYILSVLGNNKTYILGAHHVIMRTGTLKNLRTLVDNMIESLKNVNSIRGLNFISNNPQSNINLNGKKKQTPITNSIINSHRRLYESRSKSLLTKRNSKGKDGKTLTENSKGTTKNKVASSNSIANVSVNEEVKTLHTENNFNKESNTSITKKSILMSPARKSTMKVQCQVNLVEDIKNETILDISVNDDKSVLAQSPYNTNNNIAEISNIFSNTPNQNVYNLFYLLNHCKNPKLDDSINHSYNSAQNLEQEQKFEKFNKDHNIIIPKKKYFNVFKNLFESNNPENFEAFDYEMHIPEIIMIQSEFRAFKSRKKYKIYRFVVKKVVQLQKVVRGLITKRKFSKFVYCHNCIVFIQKLFRLRFERKNRAAIMIQCLWRSKAAFYRLLERMHKADNGDDDDLLHIPLYEGKKNLESELLNISIKTNRRLTGYQPINYQGQMTMKELRNETDKNKIINHLLMENILNKKIDHNLQIMMNDKLSVTKRLKDSIKHHSAKQKKLNTSKNVKIEDKLIQYGEIKKMKLQEKLFENLQNNENKYSFRPQIKTATLENTKFGGSTFLERTEMYKQKQQKRIEEIKSKIVDPSLVEYTFKPQLSELAQNTKRNRDDLFYWKHKKDENILRRKQEKEQKEIEEVYRNMSQPKISKNSEMILKYKMEKTSKETKQNETNEDFDLWPVNMEKYYFEK